MDSTDYIIAILEAHPSVTMLHMQVGAMFDPARLPSHVAIDAWEETYSEGRNAEDFVVVRFNA